MQTGTRWRQVLRQTLGTIHRELRISLTPLPRPEKWVFVVGCYNSGTTLLAQLLGAHPQISALPTEGQFLTDQYPADHEIGLPRMWWKREELYRLTESDEGPDPVRLAKEWGMRLDLSKPVLLEKSPPNCARMRWLQHHFNNAHFIVVVRNGYAVAEGIRRKAEPVHSATGWSLEDCAMQWRRVVEVVREDEPYLNKLIWTRYEDLTECPGTELQRLFAFLGFESSADLSLDGKWQVHERTEAIRNLNMESLRRLSQQDIDIVTRIGGELLTEFDYGVPHFG